MKVREIIKRITKDGWYKVGQKGSHAQFKHPVKKGRVTVPMKKGDIAIGTLKSIFKQAQIDGKN